jgi:uncharacterized membrane protein HdeD (DUF308 family)
MDTVTNDSASVQATGAQQRAMKLAKWWWAWLVAGVLWILASLVILQFRQASVTLVGVIVGIMFVVAGVQEFVVAAVTSGLKWPRVALGVLLIIGGIYALFNPVGTFLALADALGFLFALVGIFWIVEAFATLVFNEFWGLELVAGCIMLTLGFLASGQFFATDAFALLVGAGIWALLHGIGDIIRAFVIKNMIKNMAVMGTA